jgi:neutral ceramidase
MRRALIALLGVAALLAQPARTQHTVLRAGVARRDITPREPLPMWGYAARKDALSTGTLDPLTATALVIDAGGAKLAIVGLDLGRSPNEQSLQRIRERIAKAGIAHSLISGSHTHHAPVLELTDAYGRGRGRFDAAVRYNTTLESAVVDAILEAHSKLAPARLATSMDPLGGFSRNRHTKLPDPPIDRTLGLLRVDDEQGRPVAAVVNFAAHPTSIPAETLKFSADFVGGLRAEAEAVLKAPVLFLQGAAGDLSTDRKDMDHDVYGRALGRVVARRAGALNPVASPSPSLAVKEDRLKFTWRHDGRNEQFIRTVSRAFFPELVANYVAEYEDGVRPRLTVAVLNRDLVFVGVSGEAFSRHALTLRDRARASALFFIGYCNGYHQYFPTIEAFAEGGYGTGLEAAAPPGAGEQLMATALRWSYQLRGK